MDAAKLLEVADALEALARTLRRLAADQDPPPIQAGMVEEGDEVQRFMH